MLKKQKQLVCHFTNVAWNVLNVIKHWMLVPSMTVEARFIAKCVMVVWLDSKVSVVAEGLKGLFWQVLVEVLLVLWLTPTLPSKPKAPSRKATLLVIDKSLMRGLLDLGLPTPQLSWPKIPENILEPQIPFRLATLMPVKLLLPGERNSVQIVGPKPQAANSVPIVEEGSEYAFEMTNKSN